MSTVFVFYESRSGDAGLLRMEKGELRELSKDGFGTVSDQSFDSLEEFEQIPYPPGEYSRDEELERDSDGFFQNDGGMRWIVLEGIELPPSEWPE